MLYTSANDARTLTGLIMETIIAVVSLLLSIGLALFYLKDRRRAAFELESHHSDNLLAWHLSVVELLVRLREVGRDRTSDARLCDLALLSALIEQGRFFFPNIDRKDSFGQEKPSAYRGYRNLALDFLVASYNLLQRDLSVQERAEASLLQRHFTSVVFEVVRPERKLQAIRTHTDRYFVVQKSFDDFLEHQDGKIIEHIWRK